MLFQSKIKDAFQEHLHIYVQVLCFINETQKIWFFKYQAFNS